MPKQPATLGQFACPQCDKRFTRNSDVERHINNSHLGIKPFQCGYCDKAFSQKANLTRHFTSCSAARAVRAASAEAHAASAGTSSTTWSLPSPIVGDGDSAPLFPLEASLFPTFAPSTAEPAAPFAVSEMDFLAYASGAAPAISAVPAIPAAAASAAPAIPALTAPAAAAPAAAAPAIPAAPAVRTGPPRIRARRPAPYYKTDRPSYQPPQGQAANSTQSDATPDFEMLASLLSTPATFDNTLNAPQPDAPAPQPTWGDFATLNQPVPLEEAASFTIPPASEGLDPSSLLAMQAELSAHGGIVWDPTKHTLDDMMLLHAWNQNSQPTDLWNMSF